MGRVARNLLALALGLVLGASAHQAFAMPAGAVVAFNLSSCPTGWSAVTAAAGRFVVGVGTLGADAYSLAGTGGEARHTLSVAEMPSHAHLPGTQLQFVTYSSSGSTFDSAAMWQYGGSETFAVESATSYTGGGGAHENRPPYLAMLYCSLDADEQESSTSAATQAVIVGAGLVLFAIGIMIGKA